MPDLQTELRSKVLNAKPKMAKVSATSYVLDTLRAHPNTSASDMAMNRPDHIAYSTVFGTCHALFVRGVITRDPESIGTPGVKGGYKYRIADLNKVPRAYPPRAARASTSPPTRTPAEEAMDDFANKLNEVFAEVQPVQQRSAAAHRETYVVPHKAEPVQERLGTPEDTTEPRINIVAGGKSFTFKLSRAKMIYAQLGMIFG